MAKTAKTKASAPSQETIDKHIGIAKGLAGKNDGKFPAMSWFNTAAGKKHWRTYEVLRQYTKNWAGISRDFRKRDRAAKAKSAA